MKANPILQMATWFAAFIIVTCGKAHADLMPAQAAANWLVARKEICENLMPQTYMRISLASYDAATNSFISKLTNEIQMLGKPPHTPPLPPVFGADKLRWGGFFQLMKARILKERFKSGNSMAGADPVESRRELAQGALVSLTEAEKLIGSAEKAGAEDTTEEQKQWMQDDGLPGHVHVLKAHAYAMLVDSGAGRENNESAKQEWKKASKFYEGNPPPPSDELAILLGITPLQAAVMTEISWVGIVILVLCVVLSLCFTKTTLLSAWMLRALFAIGASMVATVVPGILNIDIDKRIVAGGALAIIVLFYLFNPPKLEDPPEPPEPKPPVTPP
jgi:hypothetical protein